MEEGKENDVEPISIENVDNISCHEELKAEQNSEIIGDILTIQDSKLAFPQF